jgi:phosphohistidine phosphatase
MDLLLWRHADAGEPVQGAEDLQRALTPKGEKQAARMAQWLERQLPEHARVVCSPAVRAEQTARALGRKYKLREELAPNSDWESLLDVAGWYKAKGCVLVVGHQPALGQAIARILELNEGQASVRKGAVWWVRQRERLGLKQCVLMSVQAPELL